MLLVSEMDVRIISYVRNDVKLFFVHPFNGGTKTVDFGQSLGKAGHTKSSKCGVLVGSGWLLVPNQQTGRLRARRGVDISTFAKLAFVSAFS